MLNRFQKQKPAPEQGVNQPEYQAQPGTLASRFRKEGKGAAPAAGVDPFGNVKVQKELPEGATKFDPNGNPYFGEGISGILKKWKYNYTKDVKEVDDSAWKELKERWSQMQNTPVEKMGGSERLGLLGEAAGMAWQEGTADGSLLSPLLKATGASVTAIGELFSLPAQKLEQAAGAVEEFHDYAQGVDSPLPKLDGWADNLLYSIPIAGPAYDAVRVALSSSDNKWEQAKQRIEEGWQSGRIYYSTAFDESRKQEFLAKYRAGEDPAMLAMELQNPWMELGGQLIFDPLNLVGFIMKGAKTAKQIDTVLETTTKSGLMRLESGANALKAMQESVDEISGARALDDLLKAQVEAKSLVTKSSKLLNVRYGWDALTTTSRQNAVITKGKVLLGNMALILKESGRSYDNIAEAVLSGIRSVSDNADEMRKGLAGLADLPNANMWLADDYLETFTVLNRMMSSTDGVVDGGRLRNLVKISSPSEFAEEATKLMRAAADDGFKDVAEMSKAAQQLRQAERTGGKISDETRALGEAYNALPAHVKYLDKFDRAFSGAIRNPINKVLGMAYFNLQGGVAFRNIVTNMELILIDKGPGAWFKEGKYWSLENATEFVKDIYGDIPAFAGGFESLVKASTDTKPILFGKWMEKGESAAAMRIVSASIRDTFNKMIPKAFPSLAREIEAGTITQRQANKLLNLIQKYNGNTRKAVEEFRNFYKVGNIEDWRNLDFVSSFERQSLESMDLWRDVEDLAHRGAANQADVEAVFEKLRRVIDDRAGEAVNDITGLSMDHPGAESWAEIMRAVEQGHLDPSQQHVFTALMESAEQVRLEYQELLDKVSSKAVTALQQEGRGLEAQKLMDEMNRVRDVLRRGGPATAKEAQEATNEAWRWTDEIRGKKKITPEELGSYWTRANLAGDPPIDLNKQTFLKELWKQRFQHVQQIWNSSLDAVVGESETVLSQMDGIVDTAELQSMATRTRHITQQAQAIRNTTYSGGKIVYKRPDDYLSLAHKYGIPTASKSGKPNDGALLNIVNKYSDMPDTGAPEAFAKAKWKKSTTRTIPGEYSTDEIVYKTKVGTDEYYYFPEQKTLKRLKQGSGGNIETLGDFENFDDAKKAFSTGKAGSKTTQDVTIEGQGFEGFEGGNPLQVLVGGGGLKGEELEEIFGGRLGVDKHGVMPGLFKKAKKDAFNKSGAGEGMAIDDAGRLLAENGFITKEQAEDAEFVRDFIRNYKDRGTQPKTFVEEVNDPTAPFYDEAGKLQNVPKDWKFQSLDEVPVDVLKKALDNQRRAHGMPPLPEDPGIAIPPPHAIGAQPSMPRAWNENASGAKYVLDNIKNEIVARWGKTNAERVGSTDIDTILENVVGTMEPRMNEIKAVALRIAQEQRNFTLLNYGAKTYGDVAKSYIMPYHFFYSRSYKNWISRIATDPEIVAGYGKYKENLETINKDLPDWYKQQLNINPFVHVPSMEGQTFLGIPMDHPLYINLEATVNPLYGLTGTDYFDKTKRNNWATATIDDLGKFGPSLWSPIQLGIAAMLFHDGETEVASRWGTRLFPETAQIKALTSTFLGKPVELDPSVLFFNGGIDAQERGRMAYAAAELIESGAFTAEQVQLQFQQQEGEAWELAYKMAVDSRAASSFSSYFLGVGFKPRSANDVMVERMYGDLNKLYAMADMMAPEDYRKSWEQLRAMYPTGFVDTVLLSRKGGDKRDAALAYEVLNRIPPGNMSEALASIGLSQEEIGKFYDSKGFTAAKDKDGKPIIWNKQEKARFMSAVIDLATMLKIPDDATRMEWTEARTANAAVYDELEDVYGADIWEKVSHWYDLKEDNRQAAEQFGVQHPEIFMAMQAKKAAIVNDPLLSAYYGGIETIESYIDGDVRQRLAKEFGQDIYAKQTAYYNSDTPKAYLKEHPELRSFWTKKKQYEAAAEDMFYHFAARLPEAKSAEFQEGVTPGSYTQQALSEALQPKQQIPPWEDVSANMAPWLQKELERYVQDGGQLSSRAKKQLDYIADTEGYYNSKELLRFVVLSMTNPSPSPLEQAQNPGGLLGRFANP